VSGTLKPNEVLGFYFNRIDEAIARAYLDNLNEERELEFVLVGHSIGALRRCDTPTVSSLSNLIASSSSSRIMLTSERYVLYLSGGWIARAWLSGHAPIYIRDRYDPTRSPSNTFTVQSCTHSKFNGDAEFVAWSHWALHIRHLRAVVRWTNSTRHEGCYLSSTIITPAPSIPESSTCP